MFSFAIFIALLSCIACSNGAQWELFQNITTLAGNDAEFFIIGSDIFLAFAEEWSANIYQFDTKTSNFQPFQTILHAVCLGVTFFQIQTDSFIVLASYINDYGTIYRWNANANSFQEFQQLHVVNPRKFKFTEINGAYFLGVADSTGYSTILEWNGNTFQDIQHLPLAAPQEVAFFNVATYSFAAAASAGNNPSAVYLWDSTHHQFNELQYLPTSQATDIAFYSTNGNVFIAVASLSNVTWIFQWVASTQKFALQQTVPATSNDYSVTPYEINNQTYLAIAATGTPPLNQGVSQIFAYNAQSGELELAQNLNLAFTEKFAFAYAGGANWLAAAEVVENHSEHISSQVFIYK